MKINKVLLNQELSNQQEIFDLIALTLLTEGIIESMEDFLIALNNREQEGTTGLIDGFAIPHGISDTVKESAVIYIRNNSGIEWNSLDGSLVTEVIALAISKGPKSHLDQLVSISTKLMEDAQRNTLRKLSDEEIIKSFFE